jgi:acyl carrier protein phosphodiesterase
MVRGTSAGPLCAPPDVNYLAHLYLSPPQDDALLGSLLGDFVKGAIGERFAPPVAAAIRLHRALDTFTDAHAAVQRSRSRVSAARRRYAGVMIDMFYDHFLARRWQEFHHEPLEAFSARVYALLERRHAELPERLQYVAPRMAARDWLGSYASPANVARALDGIGTRLRRANRLAGAGEELLADYAGFEADFRAFLPQARAFARSGYRSFW